MSIITELQSGVTYYLTLVGYAYAHSNDTSDPSQYPPYGFNSEVETSIQNAFVNSISINTLSAGTVIKWRRISISYWRSCVFKSNRWC